VAVISAFSGCYSYLRAIPQGGLSVTGCVSFTWMCTRQMK